MMLDFMDWDSRTQSRRVRELLLKTTQTAPSKRTKECRESQSSCHFSTDSSNKVKSQTPFTSGCKLISAECIAPMKHSGISGLKVNGNEVTFYGQPIYQPQVLLTQVDLTSYSIKPDVKGRNNTFEDYKLTIAEIIEQNSLDKSLYLDEDEIPVLVRSQKRKRIRRLHSNTRKTYSTKVEANRNVGATKYENRHGTTQIQIKEEPIESTKTVEHILSEVWCAKLKPFLTGHDNIKDNGCETASRTAIDSGSSGDASPCSNSHNDESAMHSEHVHFSWDTQSSTERLSAISPQYSEQNQSICDNKSVASNCLFTSLPASIYAHSDVVCDQNTVQTEKSIQKLVSDLRHDSGQSPLYTSNHGSPAAEYENGCFHGVECNASNNSIRYESPSSVVPDKLIFRTSDSHSQLSWFSDTESQSSTIPYALSEEDPDSVLSTVNDGNISSGPIMHNPFSVLPKSSLVKEDVYFLSDGSHNWKDKPPSICLQSESPDDSDLIHDTRPSPLAMPILTLEEPITSPIVPDDLVPDESDSDTLPDYTLLHEHSMLDDNDQDNMLYNTSGRRDHTPDMLYSTSGGRDHTPDILYSTSGGRDHTPDMVYNTSGGRDHTPDMLYSTSEGRDHTPDMLYSTSGGRDHTPGMLYSTSGGRDHTPDMLYSTSGGRDHTPDMLYRTSGGRDHTPDNHDHMHFPISDNEDPVCYTVSDYQDHIRFPLSVAHHRLHYPISGVQKHIHYTMPDTQDDVLYSLSTDISSADDILLPNYNSVRQEVYIGSHIPAVAADFCYNH